MRSNRCAGALHAKAIRLHRRRWRMSLTKQKSLPSRRHCARVRLNRIRISRTRVDWQRSQIIRRSEPHFAGSTRSTACTTIASLQTDVLSHVARHFRAGWLEFAVSSGLEMNLSTQRRRTRKSKCRPAGATLKDHEQIRQRPTKDRKSRVKTTRHYQCRCP